MVDVFTFFSFFTHNAPIYDTNKFQQNKNVHIYVLKNWLGPPVNFGLRTGLFIVGIKPKTRGLGYDFSTFIEDECKINILT